MDSNLALMIAGGIVLSIFGIISALNASIEDRSARLGRGSLFWVLAWWLGLELWRPVGCQFLICRRLF
jgi:predicted nicotinamide N-methyase